MERTCVPHRAPEVRGIRRRVTGYRFIPALMAAVVGVLAIGGGSSVAYGAEHQGTAPVAPAPNISMTEPGWSVADGGHLT
jgi:hypothetical protein